MGRLVYGSIGSLDGFMADAQGSFEWSAPGEEVHAIINERDRTVVADLYGRRLYEVMQVWETYGTGPEASPAERDFGELWRGRDKVVFSSSLESVDTARTRLERVFDPAAVRAWVDTLDGDVTIGGAELAATALRAGIVDRLDYYVNPVVVGGGKRWLPEGLTLGLRLVEQRRFDDGVVYVAYDVA